MIWKHSVSAFRCKHFKHRETNDVNTVSIYNFVALTNPMIFSNFRKFCIVLLGLLIKISWNVNRVYIFCALHITWVLRIAKLYLFGHSRERCRVHRRLAKKIIVALRPYWEYFGRGVANRTPCPFHACDGVQLQINIKNMSIAGVLLDQFY